MVLRFVIVRKRVFLIGSQAPVFFLRLMELENLRNEYYFGFSPYVLTATASVCEQF